MVMEELRIFEMVSLTSEEKMLLNSLRLREDLIDVKDELQKELDKYELEDDEFKELTVWNIYETLSWSFSWKPEIWDAKEDQKYRIKFSYEIGDVIGKNLRTFLYDFSSSLLNRTLTHEERQTLIKSCGTDDLLIKILIRETNAYSYIEKVMIDKYKAMAKKKLSELFQKDINVKMETRHIQEEDEEENVFEDILLIVSISSLYKHDFEKVFGKQC